ncbi:3555_t:CDS:2 [Funneliformis caledonium]|uniref:3555_t:CDS:1 n=1 Tax=Funneliformis caledonium TaxID=1117310 RepID=A0A9N8V600_9GLOM|nr:3555_t:CDS:2 [Funneliformis caledonium]
MNIERLISNPDPVIRQRYSQLPQMLSCIDTTSHHHKGRLTSTLINARQTPPTQRGYQLRRHVSPPQHSSHQMLQSSMAPPNFFAPSTDSTSASISTNANNPHILSEQKRRENINSGFEELKAVHYIQTLESEIQKFKQSCENPTTPNASTTPPLASPAMSTKSMTINNNTNGNLSLPPISVTLPGSSSPRQVQMHENADDSSVFALQRSRLIEKNMQQQHHADQWRSPPCQSHYQQRQNYQRTFTHPIPRFHSQYHNENLKSDWNCENVGSYNNHDHDKAYQYHRPNQNQDNLSQTYRQR